MNMPQKSSCNIVRSPLLAQASGAPETPVGRYIIRPFALLEVVRRRGRHWGLLAHYEENRLGL